MLTFPRTLSFGLACGMASLLIACGGGDPSPGPTDSGGSASTPAAAGDMGQRRKILQANPPPIANAGPDRNAYTGVPITLQGSGSDPEGEAIIGYSWSLFEAPCADGCWVFLGDSQANLTFRGTIPGDTFST